MAAATAASVGAADPLGAAEDDAEAALTADRDVAGFADGCAAVFGADPACAPLSGMDAAWTEAIVVGVAASAATVTAGVGGRPMGAAVAEAGGPACTEAGAAAAWEPSVVADVCVCGGLAIIVDTGGPACREAGAAAAWEPSVVSDICVCGGLAIMVDTGGAACEETAAAVAWEPAIAAEAVTRPADCAVAGRGVPACTEAAAVVAWETVAAAVVVAGLADAAVSDAGAGRGRGFSEGIVVSAPPPAFAGPIPGPAADGADPPGGVGTMAVSDVVGSETKVAVGGGTAAAAAGEAGAGEADDPSGSIGGVAIPAATGPEATATAAIGAAAAAAPSWPGMPIDGAATGGFGSWTGVFARSTACAIAAMSPFAFAGAAGGSSPASRSVVFRDPDLLMPAESRDVDVSFTDAANAVVSIETAVPDETGITGGLPTFFA